MRPPRHTRGTPTRLLVYGLAVLTGALLAAPTATAAGSGGADEQALLEAINRTRAEFGRHPLRLDRRLQLAAEAHSADMARKGYFDHRHFGRRIKRYRPRGRFFGENLAWHTGAGARAALIVGMWLTSPAHRAALLSRRFRRIGVAAASGPFDGHPVATLVTAEFAG